MIFYTGQNQFPPFYHLEKLMNGILGIILHRSFWAVMILGYFFILGTTCTAQSLPFLPDELTQILESGLPKTLPSPVETGHFKKLPAGDGFVWLAESTATLKKGHKLAFSKTFDAPLKEDEVGFVAVRCRIVDVDNNTNEPRPGRVLIHIGDRETLRQTALYHKGTIGREWGWYFHPFRAAKSVATGTGKIRLSFDLQPQRIEIEDVRLYVAPSGFDMSRLPMMEAGYQGREPDAPWRKEAEARIKEHRTSPLIVRVLDMDGHAIPQADVRIRMRRHAFGFGSTFQVRLVDDISPDAIRYRQTFEDLFHALVPVPALIPQHTPHAKDGNYANQLLSDLTNTLKWAYDRQLPMRGHTLVWGNLQPWSNTFVAAGEPEKILSSIRAHEQYVLHKTKDFIHEWDAINHPIRFQKDLRDVFGSSIYSKLFTEQRMMTSARLIINEALFDNTREDKFFAFMKTFQEQASSRADGIGFQSHFSINNLRGMEDLWRRYERFAPLVDRLVVTEYDFVCNDDELHADYLRDVLTLSFSHPKMTGFINWGFWAGYHWKPEGTLIRKDWTERPAVKIWQELVHEKWATNTDLQTDTKGQVETKAFFGDYEITVSVNGTSTTQMWTHVADNGPLVVEL